MWIRKEFVFDALSDKSFIFFLLICIHYIVKHLCLMVYSKFLNSFSDWLSTAVFYTQLISIKTKLQKKGGGMFANIDNSVTILEVKEGITLLS